ncbi:RING finger protein 4 isoform X2 [Anguilla rostrata]|uniref:uncharacterized protein rnf4 isoform X2 n=1 Tax=Anguilla anguilla TaxID=7936 RepID=UPI0015AE29F3|nr:uncharacterized protein rnf4 isoform X2 [Anguilla anguilla]
MNYALHWVLTREVTSYTTSVLNIITNTLTFAGGLCCTSSFAVVNRRLKSRVQPGLFLDNMSTTQRKRRTTNSSTTRRTTSKRSRATNTPSRRVDSTIQDNRRMNSEDVVDLTCEASEAAVVDLTNNDSVVLVDEGPQVRHGESCESYILSSDEEEEGHSRNHQLPSLLGHLWRDCGKWEASGLHQMWPPVLQPVPP